MLVVPASFYGRCWLRWRLRRPWQLRLRLMLSQAGGKWLQVLLSAVMRAVAYALRNGEFLPMLPLRLVLGSRPWCLERPEKRQGSPADEDDCLAFRRKLGRRGLLAKVNESHVLVRGEGLEAAGTIDVRDLSTSVSRGTFTQRVF